MYSSFNLTSQSTKRVENVLALTSLESLEKELRRLYDHMLEIQHTFAKEQRGEVENEDDALLNADHRSILHSPRSPTQHHKHTQQHTHTSSSFHLLSFSHWVHQLFMTSFTRSSFLLLPPLLLRD